MHYAINLFYTYIQDFVDSVHWKLSSPESDCFQG